MIGWRFEFGTLSDLSATIFSVFLLLLVLLVDTAVGPRPGGEDVATVKRAPLAAAAMAELLYQRRIGAAGTRVDVMSGRITVVTPSGTLALAPRALDGLLRTGRIPDPVSLYVFANESYAPVAAALVADGRAWREISVPAALRQARPGDESGWTPDFDALLGRSLPKDEFIRKLAVILRGEEKNTRNNTFGGSGHGGLEQAGGYNSAANYIMSVWTDIPVDAILFLLVCACGVAVIVLVERRPRAHGS